MAEIWTRATRQRQPQGAARLFDRFSPLWATLPTSSQALAVSGSRVTESSAIGAAGVNAYASGRFGALSGAKPAATGTIVPPFARINSALSLSGRASVLVLCKSQGAVGHGSSVIPIFGLQAGGFAQHYPFSDGNIYIGPLSSTRYLNGSISGTAAGIYDPHVAIATATSGDQRFYINGVLRGSGSAVETPSVAVLNTGFGEFGEIYFAAFFDRILSINEIATLSANPWQLFTSERRVTYFFPSGIPTLSAATAVSIGSTTATPRVTVTF